MFCSHRNGSGNSNVRTTEKVDSCWHNTNTEKCTNRSFNDTFDYGYTEGTTSGHRCLISSRTLSRGHSRPNLWSSVSLSSLRLFYFAVLWPPEAYSYSISSPLARICLKNINLINHWSVKISLVQPLIRVCIKKKKKNPTLKELSSTGNISDTVVFG